MQIRNILFTFGGAIATLAVLAHLAVRPGVRREGIRNKSEFPDRPGAQVPDVTKHISIRSADSTGFRRGSSLDDNAATVSPTTASRPQLAAGDSPMTPDTDQPSPLQNLSAQLRNHPADIEAMLEQLIIETDVEKIKAFAQLIAENAEAAGVDLPIADLLALAASGNPVKRIAALRILSTSSRVTPEMLESVANLSRTDAQKDVRFAAINTMGRWLDRNADMRSQLSAEIISARDASQSPDVRGFAIQTVGLQKNGLPQSMLDPMVQSMRTEQVPEIRSLAALALSHVEPNARPLALQNLEQAYYQETDLDARRHLLTMIMRTAGSAAPEVLQRLPANDPLLRQDVADYVGIMASGVTDVNQIYDQKNQLDGKRGTETDTDINCGVAPAGQ